MKRYRSPLVLVLGAFASPAAATLLVYEPFNYAGIGDQLSVADGSGGWLHVATTPDGATEPTIAAGNITYGTFPLVGNKAIGNSTGNGVLASSALPLRGQPWAKTENVTMYYAMLVNVTNVAGTASTTDGAFLAGFRDNGGSGGLAGFDGGATLLIRQTSGGSGQFNLGIGLTNQGGADRVYDLATSYNAATGPMLLVGSYQFVNGGSDVAKLWVNPNPLLDEASNSGALKASKTSPDFHGIGNSDTSQQTPDAKMGGFFYRNNGASPDGWEVDELRISTNWADLWTTAVPGIWQGGAGNWSTASNWSGAIVPDSVNVPVDVDKGNAAASTVTLDQDASARSLTLNSGDVLNIAATRSLNVAMTATVNGVINSSGTLTAATLSMSGATSEFHWNAGSVNVNNLQMNSGAKAFMEPGANQVLKVGNSSAVSVSGVAQLDVADNKVIVTSGDLGTWDGTSYTGITRLVQFGRNGGAWNGGGLITSMPDAATGLTTLAVAKADDIGRVSTTFGGVTLLSGDVMVMYTYDGDANLSGYIDGDDYTRIDAGYSGALSGYQNGDFNFSGNIDVDDYWIIDANYSRQGTPFSSAVAGGVSAVPEPSSAVIFGAGMLGLMRRRRRT